MLGSKYCALSKIGEITQIPNDFHVLAIASAIRTEQPHKMLPMRQGHLCTSSYCSFSRVARASIDRSLSVVNRTPACSVVAMHTPRGVGSSTRIQVLFKQTSAASNRLVAIRARIFENMIIQHISKSHVRNTTNKTTFSLTFCTERVNAALHLPTSAWSFLVTLRWLEWTALNSSLILPAGACCCAFPPAGCGCDVLYVRSTFRIYPHTLLDEAKTFSGES